MSPVCAIAAQMKIYVPRLRESRAARLLHKLHSLKVLPGLAHLYECGFVHGDIKPDNILLTSAGRIKIVDFGLAYVLDRPTSRTYLACGIPDPIDPDIYSLGRTAEWLQEYALRRSVSISRDWDHFVKCCKVKHEAGR
ncbi:hypothetical protein BOTBODRAFT_60396 [Botryobasidium botryosum FD-172 SS1]|uniref:non-specific serine/threonine protein kinase n=1 Tax=Botryobasidium botryosum (strain FD-172 SS1) TaxID=930990 RepID=A0A067LU85_BOTB1|nr:hypothetical protein BOTBODRAFT_60396 [Botryobasidium botryosum FD-172 SS1]